jgi:hypothetical protein
VESDSAHTQYKWNRIWLILILSNLKQLLMGAEHCRTLCRRTVASFNVAVGNLDVVKRRQYFSEMSHKTMYVIYC